MKTWKLRLRNTESFKRRRHKRHSVNLKVGIEADAPSPVRGRILSTHDISPEGAFIITDEPLKVGTTVFLKLLLPSGARSIVLGIVWRSAFNGMAVRFEQFCSDIMKEFGSRGPSSSSLSTSFFKSIEET